MKCVLYSNYYSDEAFDSAKEFLEEENEEGKEISDDDVFQEMSFEDEVNWDDFKYEFEKLLAKNYWLVRGTLGLWNGPAAAGKIVSSLSELSEAWRDCDYIEFTDEDGHLYLTCSHHDGTNHFEIKKLTNMGVEYMDNHRYDTDREVHDKIMRSNFYSALPKAAQFFGYV